LYHEFTTRVLMFGFGRQLLNPKFQGPSPLRTVALTKTSREPHIRAISLPAIQFVAPSPLFQELPKSIFDRSIQDIRDTIHQEVKNSFLGTPSPVPHGLLGCLVLNIGCSSGVDVFTTSILVGDTGHVIGVDDQPQYIMTATTFSEYHSQLFGARKSNISFCFSPLINLPIADNTVDVIICNNLVSRHLEKEDVLTECFRVLKQGGEMFFAKTFTSKCIKNSESITKEEPTPANNFEHFKQTMSTVGFNDIRIVKNTPTDLFEYELVLRAFKLDCLSTAHWQDLEHEVTYNGMMEDSLFLFDQDQSFVAGRPTQVSENTAAMLTRTRYAQYFSLTQPDQSRSVLSLRDLRWEDPFG